MSENLFESASVEMLAEIIREAESRMSAQQAAASAADQRALTFAGLLAAGATAFISQLSPHHNAAFWINVVVTVLLISAALLALCSARPTPWGFVGSEPGQWIDDIVERRPMHIVFAEQASHYDGAIRRNDRHMKLAGNTMKTSMVLTAIALFVAIASRTLPIF